MAEPRSLTIRLPVPNVPGILFAAIWGMLAVLFVVEELVTAPANDPGRFCTAGFLACGIVALGVAAYWLLRIPSVVVDGEAGTISVRPLGPDYRLERLQQINTWKVHTGGRTEKAIPFPCRYV